MTEVSVKELIRTPRNVNYGLIMRAIITRGAAGPLDKVFASPPAFGDTGMDQLEFGPCDWMPRSFGQSLGSLNGPAGGTATAELDGSGRTDLLTSGLQWRLITMPAGSPVTSYTSSGINVVADSHYVVQFTRPSPDGDYAIEWNVPGFPDPFIEIFTVGVSTSDPQSLPKRGDPCRIAFDSNREPFIIWWQPS